MASYTPTKWVDNETPLSAEKLNNMEEGIREAIADKKKIDELEVRVNNLARIPEGSTTADAELIDVRFGADGIAYETAGEAVRKQVVQVWNDIDGMKNKIFMPIFERADFISSEFEFGNINPDGSNMITLNNDRVRLVTTRSNDRSFILRSTDDVRFNMVTWNKYDLTVGTETWATEIFVPNNAVKYRISVSYTDNRIIEDVSELLTHLHICKLGTCEYVGNNILDDVIFAVSGHQNGTYAPIISTSRLMSTHFLKYDYPLIFENSSDIYGINAFLYDDDGNFIQELVGWYGGTNLAIPQNTLFKLFIRKLDNSEFGTCRSIYYGDFEGLSLRLNIENSGLNLERISYYGKSDGNNKRHTLVKWYDFNAESVQSLVFDGINQISYRFTGSATVYKYDKFGKSLGTVTMPQDAGHQNDCCLMGGNIYLSMNSQLETSEKTIAKWNINDNQVSIIDLSSIQDNSNGPTRGCFGLCEAYPGSGKLYLVCCDYYGDNLEHKEDDKLSVYTLDINTNEINLVCELPWNCVFIQGATCVNDVLYVVCNSPTTGSASNYTGATIKVIDMLTNTLIDEIVIKGVFEPEGMNFVTENGIDYLYFGMAKYATFSQIVRMVVPY